MTIALIQAQTIDAVTISAFVIHTIIRVDFTVLTFPTTGTAAFIAVYHIQAFAVVDARGAV
jgi:hypothetical protein